MEWRERGIGNAFFQVLPRLNLTLREASKTGRRMRGRDLVNERGLGPVYWCSPHPPCQPSKVFAYSPSLEPDPQPITFNACLLSVLERIPHGIGLHSVLSDCFVAQTGNCPWLILQWIFSPVNVIRVLEPAAPRWLHVDYLCIKPKLLKELLCKGHLRPCSLHMLVWDCLGIQLLLELHLGSCLNVYFHADVSLGPFPCVG